MKILLLADGRAVHTVRFQNELKQQGVEVILASIEDSETVDVKLSRFCGVNGIDYVLASRFLKNIVIENNIDLVNPHFASGYGFMTALSGVWKTKPVMLHCLGSDILISPQKSAVHKWRVKSALKRADLSLFDSKYLADKAQKICNSTKQKVIYWGADKAAFDGFKNKESNNFVWSQPIKVLVPRIHNKVYNNPFIIYALKNLIKDNKITLTFPNWGNETDKFKKMVQSEKIEFGVNYYGFKSRDEFNSFISEFDIYLSASFSDSSPASLIEAMAAGLYPVVGDIPGVREWVNNSNGTLFDINNKESLKKAFDKIIDTKKGFDDILIANYTRAIKDGVFSKNISETIALMKKLIDERN